MVGICAIWIASHGLRGMPFYPKAAMV